MATLQEAPATLTHVSLCGGVSEYATGPQSELFTAIITPAIIGLGGPSHPTTCDIELEDTDLDRVKEALDCIPFAYVVHSKEPPFLRVTISFGWRSTTEAVHTLMQAFDGLPFEYPRYWFSLTEPVPDADSDPSDHPYSNLYPELYVVNVDAKQRMLAIRQNLSLPPHVPKIIPYNTARWHAYAVALSETDLCDSVLVVEPKDDVPAYVELALAGAGPQDFEATLHAIVRLFPRS